MLDPSLLQEFIAETTEHLEEMEDNLLHLEKSPDNAELINGIFRCVHTVKGSAEYLGMEKIAGLTHNLESVLDRIRNGKLRVNREIIDVVISSGDVIGRLIEDLGNAQEERTSIDETLGNIVRFLEVEAGADPDSPISTSSDPMLPYQDEVDDDELFSIFVQNLREGLTELLQSFAAVWTGSSVPDVLDTCAALIDRLTTSADYMGYDQLSTLCASFKSDVHACRAAVQESGPLPGAKELIAMADAHIAGICKLFDIQTSDLGVAMASPEIMDSDEHRAGAGSPDSALDTLTLDLDETLLEEAVAVAPTPTRSTGEDPPAVEAPAGYAEDYDSELFDIFINQLVSDLASFNDDAAAMTEGGDGRDMIAGWKNKLAALTSSAAYMGYDRLTRIYEHWQDQLDAAEAAHTDGSAADWRKQVRSALAETVRQVAALFPQVARLRTLAEATGEVISETESGVIETESVDDIVLALSQTSALSDALSDKIAQMTLHAETPHEVVSDYLFSDPAALSKAAAYENPEQNSQSTDPAQHDGQQRRAPGAPAKGVATVLPVDPPSPEEITSAGEPESGQTLKPERAERPPVFDGGSDAAPSSAEAVNFSSRMRSQSIRVDADKIDALMNQVGELVVSRAWFSQLHHEMRDLKQALVQAAHIDKRLSKQFSQMTFRLHEATSSLGRAANELQEGVMRIRMLPVARLFNRYPRLIHDLVKEGDKQVDLDIRGEETELDKMVIEKISDPMIHIIRNAIDHGVEPCADRRAAGKPEAAKLVIEAYHESNHVVIEVTDDGRGIDPETIKAALIEKKIKDPAEIDRLTEREVVALIATPGFSTARTVTHTSGRGVGMDVVKKNIEKLNGTLEIDSIPGQETRVRIKIPLTLAIIPALLVRVATELFTIPLSTVEETIKVKINDIERIEGNEVIYLRNQTIPLIRLSSLFNMPSTTVGGQAVFIVIVSNGMNQMGLVVDAMLGQEEVVIKPLEDYLQESSGFSGATILGDGRISLILDIYDLLNISVAKMEQRRKARAAVVA
jgi:two-component system chemotaxis sensor kinase CheA